VSACARASAEFVSTCARASAEFVSTAVGWRFGGEPLFAPPPLFAHTFSQYEDVDQSSLQFNEVKFTEGLIGPNYAYKNGAQLDEGGRVTQNGSFLPPGAVEGANGQVLVPLRMPQQHQHETQQQQQQQLQQQHHHHQQQQQHQHQHAQQRYHLQHLPQHHPHNMGMMINGPVPSQYQMYQHYMPPPPLPTSDQSTLARAWRQQMVAANEVAKQPSVASAPSAESTTSATPGGGREEQESAAKRARIEGPNSQGAKGANAKGVNKQAPGSRTREESDLSIILLSFAS